MADMGPRRTCRLRIPRLRRSSSPARSPCRKGRSVLQPAPQTQQHNNNPQQFNNRPAQAGHLPDWLNNHQNLTSQQKENALRQEPGFNRLPQDQQQRLINRMHTLDSAPPQQRQRMLQRNEMFERLSPEQKAGVRGASQAFHQMPADRQAECVAPFRICAAFLRSSGSPS